MDGREETGEERESSYALFSRNIPTTQRLKMIKSKEIYYTNTNKQKLSNYCSKQKWAPQR